MYIYVHYLTTGPRQTPRYTHAVFLYILRHAASHSHSHYYRSTSFRLLQEVEKEAVSRSALEATVLSWQPIIWLYTSTSTAPCYLPSMVWSRGRLRLVVQDAIARRFRCLGEHGPPGRCGCLVALSCLFRWMGLSNGVRNIERLVNTSSTPFGTSKLMRHVDGFELQKFHETCKTGSAGREAAAEGAVSKAAVAGPPTSNCVHRWLGKGGGWGQLGDWVVMRPEENEEELVVNGLIFVVHERG